MPRTKERKTERGKQVENLQASHEVPNYSSNLDEVFSPESVRPFPKAAPRKRGNGRKTRKSAISTDTPEKEAIRVEYEEKENNRAKQNLSSSENEKMKAVSTRNSNNKKPRRPTPLHFRPHSAQMQVKMKNIIVWFA
ncbi:hypothetical protein JTB14_027357 [Gonioctena quinquepunctata]|nr:hypothetical protein JTB14_027357 [Gonioctena quinquepunctata]